MKTSGTKQQTFQSDTSQLALLSQHDLIQHLNIIVLYEGITSDMSEAKQCRENFSLLINDMITSN